MAARVSLSVDGIEPSVLERAEVSARRAGLSFGDWLNSTIGHPGASHPGASHPAVNHPTQNPEQTREAQDVAEIHKRLDSIARQVEHMSRAPAAAKGDPAVARQL